MLCDVDNENKVTMNIKVCEMNLASILNILYLLVQ